MTREPEPSEIKIFSLCFQMTRKTVVINGKCNNQWVFISMCICEHSVCNAHCDYQGKLGQAVLTASPAQFGWVGFCVCHRCYTCSVLGRRSTCETGTLNVETCTFTLPGFGTSSSAVIAKERLCLSLSGKKFPAVQM